MRREADALPELSEVAVSDATTSTFSKGSPKSVCCNLGHGSMRPLADISSCNVQNRFFDLIPANKFNFRPAVFLVAKTETDILESGGKTDTAGFAR